MVAPLLETMAKEHAQAADAVRFYKVDVDANMELASRLGISAMPTFHIYSNGKLASDVVGANIDKIVEAIAVAQGAAKGEPISVPAAGSS